MSEPDIEFQHDGCGLTRASIRLDALVVPGLANIAIPVLSATVRTNTIAISDILFYRMVREHISKVQTTIHWEFKPHDLSNVFYDGLDTPELLLSGHFWPSLM